MLSISQLAVTVDQKKVLNNFSLIINPGSIHAIMGPNGSGKSSFAYALAGHPSYELAVESLVLNNQDILAMSPAQRCKAGLFVAFQNPIAIPGLSVYTLLKESFQATTQEKFDIAFFMGYLTELFHEIGLDPSFMHRQVNEGFSGGEKKRLEIVQMRLLKPTCVILDEIDSGLDVDALKMVAASIMKARAENPFMSIVLITHYQRILQYIAPDFVHIVCDGRLAASGDHTLSHDVEARGYDEYRRVI